MVTHLNDFAVADPGFSPGGAPTPKSAIIFQFFAENCMKMKEFGPPGGGARPWRPPLDPPMFCTSEELKRSRNAMFRRKPHVMVRRFGLGWRMNHVVV